MTNILEVSSQKPSGLPSSIRVRSFRRKLLNWFCVGARQLPWRGPAATSYERIVVELLLQRTRAATVAAFLPGFLARYPSWSAIASSSVESLNADLKPLGLWRRRALALFALAKEIDRRREKWPCIRSDLEAMPAVGQYIASAILLFVHKKREALMDASMARLLRRFFYLHPIRADIRHDKLLHETAHLVLAAGDSAYLNWAMLDIAASICKVKKPKCRECPLNRTCKYLQ